MERLSRVAVVAALLLLSACSRYSQLVYAAADPDHRPTKGDPLYLALPRDSSIRERQLLHALRHSLCLARFNVVDTPNKSKWTMGLSYDRQTYNFGTATTVAVTPTNVTASSRPQIANLSAARLYLFRTTDLLGNAEPLLIWEGTAAANVETFNHYEASIFKNVLDHFGQSIERRMRLEKADFYAAQAPCPPG